jgi:predicted metal-binding membrane protein
VSLAAPDAAARRVPVGIVIGIAAGWIAAILVVALGKGGLADHHAIAEGDLPIGIALVTFLVGWQVMVAAMMLPSTVPLFRMFRVASAKQDRPGLALGLFLAGYAVVWGLAGWIALLGDLVLHAVIDAVPTLDERPQLISGGVLVLAGAFQFTELEDRCLTECRHPAMWMLRHYRRGAANAFHLGQLHGRFCLGCCWALMLLMFAVGVMSLLWMAALAGFMAYEKIGRHGEVAGKVAGVALIAWGLLVLGGADLVPA